MFSWTPVHYQRAIAAAGVRTQSTAGGGTYQFPFVVLKVPQITAVCPLLVFAGFSCVCVTDILLHLREFVRLPS